MSAYRNHNDIINIPQPAGTISLQQPGKEEDLRESTGNTAIYALLSHCNPSWQTSVPKLREDKQTVF